MEDFLSEESVLFLLMKVLMNFCYFFIFVSFDLYYLFIGVFDLVSYLENFKFLKQFFVVFVDGINIIFLNFLVLKLSSFVMLFLIGLLSRNIDSLKCVFFNLEVLFILECYYLIFVEIFVINILIFIL